MRPQVPERHECPRMKKKEETENEEEAEEEEEQVYEVISTALCKPVCYSYNKACAVQNPSTLLKSVPNFDSDAQGPGTKCSWRCCWPTRPCRQHGGIQ